MGVIIVGPAYLWGKYEMAAWSRPKTHKKCQHLLLLFNVPKDHHHWAKHIYFSQSPPYSSFGFETRCDYKVSLWLFNIQIFLYIDYQKIIFEKWFENWIWIWFIYFVNRKNFHDLFFWQVISDKKIVFSDMAFVFSLFCQNCLQPKIF